VRSQRERDNKLSIKQATAADAAAIHSILAAAFAEFRHLYTPEAYVATVVPENDVRIRLTEGPIWIAERESEVLGTVSAVVSGDCVAVRGMAVNPNVRGLGIGRTLLKVIERFAYQQGCDQLSLFTTAFLSRAIRLYESSGFKFTGELSSPHGTELSRMVKSLRL
jgi:GNAT superfamily N-acetyltransferase